MTRMHWGLLVLAIVLVWWWMNGGMQEGFLGMALTPAPVNYSINANEVPYATGGIKFKQNHSEYDALYNQDIRRFFVPQGTPQPLAHEAVTAEIPENSMFIFSKNVSSPLCCPATYSDSRGCVCTTKAQRNLIGFSRGNNNTCATYPYI